MEREDKILHDDMVDVLCGELIGRGSRRDVFRCDLKEGYVVKVEKRIDSRQNLQEFMAWETVMLCEHSKWFAHIYSMSPMGRVLIMEKTVRPRDDEWPEMIPAYFTDIKRENFGITTLTDPNTGEPSNRFVCHDYGHNLLSTMGLTKRMQKVDWKDLPS